MAAGRRTAHELVTNHGGGAAYVIDKATAGDLLSRADSFSHNVDVELFDPQRRAMKELTVYQWIPAPCMQDMLMDAGELRIKSNVGFDRSDFRAGILRPPWAITQALRSHLRPLYTALFSLCLLPQGMKRWT